MPYAESILPDIEGHAKRVWGNGFLYRLAAFVLDVGLVERDSTTLVAHRCFRVLILAGYPR